MSSVIRELTFVSVLPYQSKAKAAETLTMVEEMLTDCLSSLTHYTGRLIGLHTASGALTLWDIILAGMFKNTKHLWHFLIIKGNT